MSGAILLMMFLGFILFIGILAFNADRPPRAQRIGRKDAKAILADNKEMLMLLNDLDVQARVELDLNPTTSHFAGYVAREVAKTRRELTS